MTPLGDFEYMFSLFLSQPTRKHHITMTEHLPPTAMDVSSSELASWSARSQMLMISLYFPFSLFQHHTFFQDQYLHHSSSLSNRMWGFSLGREQCCGADERGHPPGTQPALPYCSLKPIHPPSCILSIPTAMTHLCIHTLTQRCKGQCLVH